jgi:hypothetical protein
MVEGLELFQYYKGIMIGLTIGLGFGWLIWRLPVYLRTRHVRKLRRIVLDVRRIEAMFLNRRTVPNPRELRVRRIPLRQRMTETWQVYQAEWRAATAPRTPEQVAEEAYQRELMEAT